MNEYTLGGVELLTRDPNEGIVEVGRSLGFSEEGGTAAFISCLMRGFTVTTDFR